MKSKKLTKKLALNKATISNLESREEMAIRGGYLPTILAETCYTWCAACYTRATCPTNCNDTCERTCP